MKTAKALEHREEIFHHQHFFLQTEDLFWKPILVLESTTKNKTFSLDGRKKVDNLKVGAAHEK